MNIITGYTGTPHITSAQDRAGNMGSYGTGSYILDVGSKLAATIISANEIRIADGAVSHQGCLANIGYGAYDSVSISNGSQGMQRRDLIVCRYERNASTNVESMNLVVIEGTPVASSPSDPAYNSGSIRAGDSPVDMPLYRVTISGVNISSVTRIADYVKTQTELASDINAVNTNVSNYAIRFKTGTITIAGGSSTSPVSATLSISDIRPSTSYSPYAAFLQIGDYALPYQSVSGWTRIARVATNAITILNTAGAYSDLTYYLTVVYKKI